jgi:hypothetical protein
MDRDCSVDKLNWLLGLAKIYSNVRDLFDETGHAFAGLFVDSRTVILKHVADAVATHPDIDPKEMGVVLSTYFEPADLVGSDAPESIRRGFVFPQYSWDASHETNELEECCDPVELNDCREAADPALLEAFRCASQRTVSGTPTTKLGWFVYVLTAEHGAERSERALSALKCDAMHPEVVFGIVSRCMSCYRTTDHIAATAQILADGFERRARPPVLVLPAVII